MLTSPTSTFPWSASAALAISSNRRAAASGWLGPILNEFHCVQLHGSLGQPRLNLLYVRYDARSN
jgi:hypothetical protein